MSGLFNVHVVGNLAADPAPFGSGDKAGVRVVVYANVIKDKPAKITVFLRKHAANFASQYLRRGSEVTVLGSMSYDLNTGGVKQSQDDNGVIHANYTMTGYTILGHGGRGDNNNAAPDSQVFTAANGTMASGNASVNNDDPDTDEPPF